MVQPRAGRGAPYTPALAAMLIYLNRTGFNGLFPLESTRRVQRAGGAVYEPADL
jgi:hypothetical protein